MGRRSRFVAMLLVSSLFLLSSSSHGMMWILFHKFTIHSGIYSFSSKMHEINSILCASLFWDFAGLGRKVMETVKQVGSSPVELEVGVLPDNSPFVFSSPESFWIFPASWLCRKAEGNGGRWRRWWITLIPSRTPTLGLDTSWALLLLLLDMANSQFPSPPFKVSLVLSLFQPSKLFVDSQSLSAKNGLCFVVSFAVLFPCKSV